MSVSAVYYTYLIGWSKQNKWYYGVQFRKTAHPSNLWSKYFTSSKRVKNMRRLHGEPDVISIRKTFDVQEKARDWEQKVLRRLHLKDSKWLNCQYNNNQYINKGGYALTEEQKKARKGPRPWARGRIPSEESKEKHRITRKKNGIPAWNKGISRPQHLVDTHAKLMSGSGNPMFGKSAITGRKWYTNGVESVLIYPHEAPERFVSGRHTINVMRGKSTEKKWFHNGKTYYDISS